MSRGEEGILHQCICMHAVRRSGQKGRKKRSMRIVAAKGGGFLHASAFRSPFLSHARLPHGSVQVHQGAAEPACCRQSGPYHRKSLTRHYLEHSLTPGPRHAHFGGTSVSEKGLSLESRPDAQKRISVAMLEGREREVARMQPLGFPWALWGRMQARCRCHRGLGSTNTGTG